MQYLFYNDDWLPDQQPLLTAGNRGFRYGDGVFETLCVVNGAIRLSRYHFERLFESLKLLQLRLPAHYTPAYLSERIFILCEKNNHSAARVRLTVFRGEGNLFDPPDASPPGCIIESQALPATHPAVQPALIAHSPALTMATFPVPRGFDSFSRLKSNNYLVYAMAARHARENGLDDVLLLNTAHRVTESSIANVFMVKDDQILTPPLEEGCVDGVMRRFMLEHLPAIGYKVKQEPLPWASLLVVDEIFLTNALHLLRPVKRCDNQEYGFRHSTAIYKALGEKWLHAAQLSD